MTARVPVLTCTKCKVGGISLLYSSFVPPSVNTYSLFCDSRARDFSSLSKHSSLSKNFDLNRFNFNFKSYNFSKTIMASVTVESPLKRKITSPSVSPTKKSIAMEVENLPSDGVLKEITGNQLISTGVESPSKEKSCPRLLFKKMSENAFEPTKGSKLAAGFDLKSAYEYTVPKRGSCLVKTDIQIQLPNGTYGRVAPRSGLALKNQIDVGAGVIDEDYRGNVGVILFNHGDEDFKIEKGDRIAQLICEKICYPEIVEVESLEDSDRGAGGFGSTGVSTE